MTRGVHSIVRKLRIVSRIFFAVGVGITVVIMLLTTADVLSRHFFNRPIAFTFELTEIMMILVTFLGLGYVTAKNRHIEVDILVPKLPIRLQGIIGAFNSLLGIGIFALIAWKTAERASQMLRTGEITEILGLPMAPAIFIVSIGSILLCMELIVVFAGSIGEAVKGTRNHFYIE